MLIIVLPRKFKNRRQRSFRKCNKTFSWWRLRKIGCLAINKSVRKKLAIVKLNISLWLDLMVTFQKVNIIFRKWLTDWIVMGSTMQNKGVTSPNCFFTFLYSSLSSLLYCYQNWFFWNANNHLNSYVIVLYDSKN